MTSRVVTRSSMVELEALEIAVKSLTNSPDLRVLDYYSAVQVSLERRHSPHKSHRTVRYHKIELPARGIEGTYLVSNGRYALMVGPEVLAEYPEQWLILMMDLAEHEEIVLLLLPVSVVNELIPEVPGFENRLPKEGLVTVAGKRPKLIGWGYDEAREIHVPMFASPSSPLIGSDPLQGE